MVLKDRNRKERTVLALRCSIWYPRIGLYLEYLSKKVESIKLIDVNYILDGSASVNEDLR